MESRGIKIGLFLFAAIFMSCEQPTDFARDNSNDFASDIFRPDQPASLDAKVLSDSTVKLEWTHQNSDSVKFAIQVSINNQPYTDFGLTDADVSEYSGTLMLDLDSEYKFRIAGVKEEQRSNFTEAESFVFRVNPPANLTVGGSESSEAQLDWSSGNDFDTNYIVEVKQAGMDSFTTVSEEIEGTSFVLNNPDPAAETEVRIAAQTERYRSEYQYRKIVFEQLPRMLRQVENNFSRDADYLMYSGTRRIVIGDGNEHWFINSSASMQHLAKSINDDLEITLYDENNNLILSFDAYPDLEGSPPAIPPNVLVSSKWKQIVVKYYNHIQIRDFDGNLLHQSPTYGTVRDVHLSNDENYLIALHYTPIENFQNKIESKFEVWSLPDFEVVSSYEYILEADSELPSFQFFELSTDNTFIAAITEGWNNDTGLYLFRINENMTIFDYQYFDLELEKHTGSMMFSHDSKFLFMQYYTPETYTNLIMIDLEQSNSYKKLHLQKTGKLKPFDQGPYFLAIQSNIIAEYSYDYYWFFND